MSDLLRYEPPVLHPIRVQETEGNKSFFKLSESTIRTVDGSIAFGPS